MPDHLEPGSERSSLAVAGASAARLVAASRSPRTLQQYRSALRRFDAWLAAEGLEEGDAAVALYLGRLDALGRAAASAAVAVAALRFRAANHGRADPVGRRASAALRGFRRTAAKAGRGRGQAAPLRYEDVLRVLATASRPRRRGRGLESAAVAERRGRLDAALAALAFMGGLRRSEIAALRWRDVEEAGDGEGLLVDVVVSKTNQEGERRDLRYLKGDCADAVRALRGAAAADPSGVSGAALVAGGLNGASIGRRIAAAARAAGVEGRVTGHSGRIGLASELVSRGASTADTMLAGGWRTARMVARYAAGATAERGAVARHF